MANKHVILLFTVLLLLYLIYIMNVVIIREYTTIYMYYQRRELVCQLALFDRSWACFFEYCPSRSLRHTCTYQIAKTRLKHAYRHTQFLELTYMHKQAYDYV